MYNIYIYMHKLLLFGIVPRSLANLIRNTAARSPSFGHSIPLNRDDESRIEAIERELIKLGSHVSVSVIAVTFALCVCVCLSVCLSLISSDQYGCCALQYSALGAADGGTPFGYAPTNH